MKLEDLAQGLPPTERLYLKDSYLTKFSAKMLREQREGKNRVYMVLDSTAYHPKSGGQPSDTGLLKGSDLQVRIAKVMGFRDIVVHWGTVEGETVSTVYGEIDWEPRYLYMRRHTGGHLLDHCLTAVLKDPVGTTDSWLGEGCYVAYRGAVPPMDAILEAVEMGNQMIQRGGGVRIQEIGRKELIDNVSNAPNILRLPSLEKYRVVTIQGCDPIPCGGTHLRDIEEIGFLKLGKVEQQGEGFRIYYDVESLK